MNVDKEFSDKEFSDKEEEQLQQKLIEAFEKVELNLEKKRKEKIYYDFFVLLIVIISYLYFTFPHFDYYQSFFFVTFFVV